MASPVIHIPGFEYVRELGVGGMATVYLAIQRSLDRKVAIKVMKRAGADENFEKRFLLEGRTMAKLQHRNIVGVYDIVQNDEINYIAMEFLGGGTLSDRLRQGLSLADAIAVVVQTAGALQFAHDHEVVHRDLKPANIMFRDDHTPVLTDFGIARAKDQAATRLTQTGMMIGTPTYMSPEQAMGSDVDGRSDQYSLGILFYEMLTGAPPFGGETPLNVVLAHINQPPPPLPGPFAQFQPVLDKMLAKDREQRYSDLHVFVRELKAMLTGSDTLLSKLHIDPNETSSEQLRALGFSDSQINTGTRRAANRGSTGQRAAARNTTGSGPGVYLPPDRPQRPRWLLPVGIAAVVLGVAIGLWAMFGGKDKELEGAELLAVNSFVANADRLIEQGKLVAPPGDNALEQLQAAQQFAPDFAPVSERLAKIAATLKQKAETAIASRKFDVAEARIGEALIVAPDDASIVALQKRIATAKQAAATEGKVATLVQQSQDAQKAGKLYGEGRDNALVFARQAVELNPQSVAAKAQLNAITDAALTGARSALKARKLDEAATLLEASAAYFAAEQPWKQLESELEKARTVAEQKSRIDELLAQANRQSDAGSYAEPAGDNALETLQRVAELDPDNADAAALRREIGVASSAAAQKAQQAGDAITAIERYDDALRAQPDNADYKKAKLALEQSLGEQQKRLTAALSKARDAIQDRRYLAPAGNNAREALDAVLQIDANNADARRLREQLPELVRDAAGELSREKRFDEALALLADAIAQFPGDAQFIALNRSLSGERDKIKLAGERQKQLGDLQGLVASGQLSADNARAIAAAVAALLKLDPNDAEPLRQRDRFLADVSSAMTMADSPERLEALRPVLDEAKKGFGATATAALQTSFATATTAMQEKESARLALISGTLVLNAFPWASVESVVEQATNKPVALPSERSTPLRLKLPAGNYRVTFRHPQATKAVVLGASVQAQKTQTTNAPFPQLSARDYLKRAGYGQ